LAFFGIFINQFWNFTPIALKILTGNKKILIFFNCPFKSISNWFFLFLSLSLLSFIIVYQFRHFHYI
jgi:hypothetical protein